MIAMMLESGAKTDVLVDAVKMAAHLNEVRFIYCRAVALVMQPQSAPWINPVIAHGPT